MESIDLRSVILANMAKIMGEIAEKYNGILSVQVHNGLFSVTTTLCLDEKNEE